MRAFICKRCRELAPFESQTCGACGVTLGFDPVSDSLEPLVAKGRMLVSAPLETTDAPGVPVPQSGAAAWAPCQRAALTGCNWLLPPDQAGEPCLSCRLTSNLPALRRKVYREAFAKAEGAKRRLVYQLLQLRLPIIGKREDPRLGLSFELLAGAHHIVTGHSGGVITLDLNETDDVFREQARAQFGEPYRTLLGHFRHEIGHYYWPLLVAPAEDPGEGTLEASARTLLAGARGVGSEVGRGQLVAQARAIFGDERADYDAARNAHYDQAHFDQTAQADWGDQFVSAYAAMHPLEDWAETFAHYLHIWDAVQTAASFGVLVVGPVDDRTGRRDPAKASVPSEDTASLEGFDAVIADWLPLTLALNALNRSLGKDDLYPFDLPPAVTAKLAFVHKVISGASGVMSSATAVAES